MQNEMLGNKYFMQRNYLLARSNYEYVLRTDPSNKAIKKKLIICYSQSGKIKEAFKHFLELARVDINFIIDTDPNKDDCPCADLIGKFDKIYPYEENSTDMKLMLGMLWLYCDKTKSLRFFKTLNKENPECEDYPEVIKLIENSN